MSEEDDLNIAQRHRFGGVPLLETKQGRRVVDAVTGILVTLIAVLAWKLLHRDQLVFFDPAPGHKTALRGAIVPSGHTADCRLVGPVVVGLGCRRHA